MKHEGDFMGKIDIYGNLTIEESDFRSLKKIEPECKSIIIINSQGPAVDGSEMAEYFSHLQGIEGVEHLNISFSSSLEDVKIIKGFQNLKTLFVRGKQIKSFNGLEYFQKGQLLDISTDKNKKRNLVDINKAPINRLGLEYARSEDFDAIATSRSITSIDLGGCPQPPFDQWAEVPLLKMRISRGKFVELINTNEVKSLKKMDIFNCRKFERFVGDNSGITRLMIDGCKSLDLSTLKTLKNLEDLTILMYSNEFKLSTFEGLEKLKGLTFLKCYHDVDVIELKNVMPSLEQIFIEGLKKDKVQELGRLNPQVRFSFR